MAVVALALAAAGVPAAGAQSCPGADARPHEASADTLGSGTLCLLNRERADRGLRAVRRNNRLTVAARRHALDMVRRSYFSHDSPSGADFADRIRRTGYTRASRSWWLGENLAWGSRELATPRSIVRAWMRSPGHRANVLNPRFEEIGLGVADGAPASVRGDAATYVTDFGTRS